MIIFRLSVKLKAHTLKLSDTNKFHILQGTGSSGATVRIYIEQFEPDVSNHDMDAQVAWD